MPASPPHAPVVGTLPIEDHVADLEQQEQCGWLYVGAQRLPLFTGVNIVGTHRNSSTFDVSALQRQHCEVEWARRFGKASVQGILLDNPTVSQTHLMLEVSASGSICVATDLSSSNGTWLCAPGSSSGLRLQAQDHHYILRTQDVLRLGACHVCVTFMPVCQFVASTHAEQLQLQAMQQGAAHLQLPPHAQQERQLLLQPHAQQDGQLPLQPQKWHERPSWLGQTAALQDPGHAHSPRVQRADEVASAQGGGCAGQEEPEMQLAAGSFATRPCQHSADALTAQAQQAAVLQQQQLQQQQAQPGMLGTRAQAAGANAGGPGGGALGPAVQAPPTIVHAGSAVIVVSPHAAAVPQLLSGLHGYMPSMQQHSLQVMQQQQQQAPLLPAPPAERPCQQQSVQESPLQLQQVQSAQQGQPAQLQGLQLVQQQQQQLCNIGTGTPHPALSSASNVSPSRSPVKQVHATGLEQPSQQEVQPLAGAMAAATEEQLCLQQRSMRAMVPYLGRAAAGTAAATAAGALQQQQQPSDSGAAVVEGRPSDLQAAAGSGEVDAAATPRATPAADNDNAGPSNTQQAEAEFQARVAAVLAQDKVTWEQLRARRCQANEHSYLYSDSSQYSSEQQQQQQEGPESGRALAGHFPPPGYPIAPCPALLNQAKVMRYLQELQAQQACGGTSCIPPALSVMPAWQQGPQQPAVPGPALVNPQHQAMVLQQYQVLHAQQAQQGHGGAGGVPPALSFVPGMQQGPQQPGGMQQEFAAQFQQLMLQHQHVLAVAHLQQPQQADEQPQQPGLLQQQQGAQSGLLQQRLLPLQKSGPSMQQQGAGSGLTPTQQQQGAAGRPRRLLPSASDSSPQSQPWVQQQQQQRLGVLDTIPEGPEGLEGTPASLPAQPANSQHQQTGLQEDGILAAAAAAALQKQQGGDEEEDAGRLLGTLQHGSAGDSSWQPMQQGPLPPTQLLGTADCSAEYGTQDAPTATAMPGSPALRRVAAQGAAGEASDQVVSASPTRSPTGSLCSDDVGQQQQQRQPEQHDPNCQQQHNGQKDVVDQDQQQQQSLPAETEDVDPAGWALWRLQGAARTRSKPSSGSLGPDAAGAPAAAAAAADVDSAATAAPAAAANVDSAAAAAAELAAAAGALTTVAADRDGVTNAASVAAAAAEAAAAGGGAEEPIAAAAAGGRASEDIKADHAAASDAACIGHQQTDEGRQGTAVVSNEANGDEPTAAPAAAAAVAAAASSPPQPPPAAAGAGAERAPVPLFGEVDGLTGVVSALQGRHSAAAADGSGSVGGFSAAAAAGAPCSPAVTDPSIGFGTQLALQGLADLARTPGSGSKSQGAVVGLRALCRADVLGLELNPADRAGFAPAAAAAVAAGGGDGNNPNYLFGFADSHESDPGADVAGGGKAVRGRVGRGRGRGRGRLTGRKGAERGRGHHTQAAGRGKGSGAAGGVSQKRRRSRSRTPNLSEDDGEGPTARAAAAAGGSAGVQAAAAAAAGDGDGVRRSKRATAGKKAPDIMFTQAEYLDLLPSPLKAHHSSSHPLPRLSPVANPTRHPLVLHSTGWGVGSPSAAGGGRPGGHAAVGHLLQQLQHGKQQQREEGVFKVPAPPKSCHKRGRGSDAAGAAGSTFFAAAAAAAAAAPEPAAATAGAAAAAKPVETDGRNWGKPGPLPFKKQPAGLNGVATGSASPGVVGLQQQEQQQQEQQPPQQSAASAAAEAAAEQQCQHIDPTAAAPAAAAAAAAADAGGSFAKQGCDVREGPGASPDVVEQGTRADQLPISSAYAGTVLSAAAAAAETHSGDSNSLGTQGSAGSRVKKKVTSRKSSGGAHAFREWQQLAMPSAAGAAAAAAPAPAAGGGCAGLQLSEESTGAAAAAAAPAAGWNSHHNHHQQQIHSHTGSRRRRADVSPLALPPSPGDSCPGSDLQQGPPAGPATSSPWRPLKSRRTQQVQSPAAAAAAAAAAAGAEAVVTPRSPAELASLAFPAAANVSARASRTPAAAAATAAAAAGGGWVPGSVGCVAVNLKGAKHGAAESRVSSMCIEDDVSPRTAAAIAAAAADSPLKRFTRSSGGIRGEQQGGASGGGACSGGARSSRGSSRERDPMEGPPVVALVKALCVPVETKARYVVGDILKGRLATAEDDPSVTHLLGTDYVSPRKPLTCSFKLLLAVARGVPVVDADRWLSACEKAGGVVPVKAHLLELRDMLQAKGLPKGTKLSDAYWRAQQELSQGRSVLCGIPCLLSPCAAQADKISGNLALLLQVAGGVVLPGPDPATMPPASLAASGFASGGKPPGLIITHSEGPGVAGKDLTWARESGFEGWPVYSKDWLIRSVLTFAPDWARYSGIV